MTSTLREREQARLGPGESVRGERVRESDISAPRLEFNRSHSEAETKDHHGGRFLSRLSCISFWFYFTNITVFVFSLAHRGMFGHRLQRRADVNADTIVATTTMD